MLYQIPDECPACGVCISNCPTGAITVRGRLKRVTGSVVGLCQSS